MYICSYILYYRNCSSSSYWTLNYLWQMGPLPGNEWKVMNHLVLHFCTTLCGLVSIKKYLLVYNFELGKWYFVTKIVLTYCGKKFFYWSRKTFEIRGWRPRICKNFEITRTIYSNSERSEQFLVIECFFNLFLEVSQV